MIAFVAFAVLLLLLLLVVVLSAFREEEADGGPDPRSARARRDAALEVLRGIEFDYRTGKLSEGEYRILRARWAREAVRARDEALSGEGKEASEAPERTAGAGDARAPAPGCPACGFPGRPESRFCPRCGTDRSASGPVRRA